MQDQAISADKQLSPMPQFVASTEPKAHVEKREECLGINENTQTKMVYTWGENWFVLYVKFQTRRWIE